MSRRERGWAIVVALALTLTLTAGCGSGNGGDRPATANGASPDAARPAVELFFEDVTDAAGIDFVHAHGGTGIRYLPETMSGGGAVLDYDGDGLQDLYFVQSAALPGAGYDGPRLTNQLFRNRGDGTFEVVRNTPAAMFARTSGAVLADLDNDGDVDLYVANNCKGKTGFKSGPQRAAQL